MNKLVKNNSLLVVSDLMIATGILIQNNGYQVSINVNIKAASDKYAYKYLARFQNPVKTQRNMEVCSYTRIKANILLNISQISCYLVNKLWKKTAFDTNGSPRHLHIVLYFHTWSMRFVYKLKQFIHLNWLLNILYQVSRSYLVISSQKNALILSIFWKRRSSIIPPKKYRMWSQRLRLILRSISQTCKFSM